MFQYKYRVIKSNENSSHTRFHFSDDQNIASQNRPVFEIEIMEEDDRYLPKRLLQVRTKFLSIFSLVCLTVKIKCFLNLSSNEDKV
jgi:hypothetical protein